MNLIAHQALVFRQLVGEPGDLVAQEFAGICDFVRFQIIEVRHHDRVQPLSSFLRAEDSDDGDLLDAGILEVMRFQFIRIDILPVGQYDDFFFPARDEQISFGVKPAEVSRVKPSVLDSLFRRGGIFIIPLHHHRAADQNFSGSRFVGREDLTSTPGSGGPTEPTTLFSTRVTAQAPVVSVSPYPWRMVNPMS